MKHLLIGSLIFVIVVAARSAGSLAGELTVKDLSFGELGDGDGFSGNFSIAAIAKGAVNGWAYSCLFDGTNPLRNSVMICQAGSPFSPQSDRTLSHNLFSLDHPQIHDATFTVAGRWAAVHFETESRKLVTDTQLLLTADYSDGSHRTAITSLADIGQSSTPFQPFHLPITSPTGIMSPTQLALSITAPATITYVLEDVRLVAASGSAIAQKTPKPAGTPPAAMLPTAGPLPPQMDYWAWENWFNLTPFSPVGVLDTDERHTLIFRRRPADGSSRRVSIYTIDTPKIAAGDFGITGMISYAGTDLAGNFDGSAYFELTAFFPDGTKRIVGTTASSGPCQLLSGHADDRAMQLAMHSNLRPTRLQLQLVADGTGEVTFTNLSLVQFQPPLPATSLSLSSVPSHWSDPGTIRAVGWATVLFSLMMAIGIVRLPQLAFFGVAVIIFLIIGEVLFAWAMFLLGQHRADDTVAPLFAGALAWLVPLLARRIAMTRQHARELRKMLTLDAT